MLEPLFNKAAVGQVCNFIKKRLQHRRFPVNIAKFLRRPNLKNICERLLLQSSFVIKLHDVCFSSKICGVDDVCFLKGVFTHDVQS